MECDCKQSKHTEAKGAITGVAISFFFKQKYTILLIIPGIWIAGNFNNLFPCYINPFSEMHHFEAKAGLGSDTGGKPGSLCLEGKYCSLTWILMNLFPI